MLAGKGINYAMGKGHFSVCMSFNKGNIGQGQGSFLFIKKNIVRRIPSHSPWLILL